VPEITPEEQAKADSYREQAKASRQRAYESFERSDTDGFMSQWASTITANELDLKAELIEQGGVIETSALFDLSGHLILAKEIETRFGWAWMILDPENPKGQAKAWFNPSKAKSESTRRKTNAAKGYYIGRVKAKAYIKIIASGSGMSGAASAYPGYQLWRNEETGAPEIMEIIDNGQ